MNQSVAHFDRPRAGAAVAVRKAQPDAREQGSRLAQLRGMLDALPAGVVLIDGDGKVSDCNAGAIDLLGPPLQGLYWREIIERAFVPKVVVDGLVLTDGRVVTVTTAPLGTAPGQVVLLNDVTQTRVVQALAHRHQRLSSMGEMVASLSHQIRTPLASCLLYLSQLEHDALAPQGKNRRIEKIRACLDHLDKLTRDMLAFAGGGALSDEDISVSSLLDEFRQLSVALIEKSRCRLELIDDSRGANIRGNRGALLTVLQNIVENAIHACADSAARTSARAAGGAQQEGDRRVVGNLRLLIRRTDQRAGMEAIELLLSDDGPGIPPETRARVLEPFFTTKPNGTGLGLSVACAVAQAHKGAIWIESEPGVGATVGIRLPISNAHRSGS